MPKKGHTNNPKGRPKGTPNKVTGDLRQWLNKLVDDNRTTFEADLKELEPAQRLQILEKLMQYCTPKLQAISVEAQIASEYDNLRKLLESCPDELLDKLEQKILTLNKLKNENKKS